MSSDVPKVAVLLAAYNGMAWIEEQLASIQAQTAVNASIFISVDTSTDGTDEFCVEYQNSHRNVTVLPSVARFGGAARNFFRLLRDVDLSSFEYVAFADQDDIWKPEKLKRGISLLGAGLCDGYSSNVIAFWPDGRTALVDKAQPQVAWDYVFEAAGPGCTYILTQSLASEFKKSLVANWQQAQQVSLHDWYCYAFARGNGYRWHIDPQPGLYYRQHSNNQIGVNSGLKAVKARLSHIRSGWWFSQIRLISSLVQPRGGLAMIASNGRISFVRLACMARQCRRRGRDQLLFAMICLLELVR
jgi:rhamnosyltransferase